MKMKTLENLNLLQYISKYIHSKLIILINNHPFPESNTISVYQFRKPSKVYSVARNLINNYQKKQPHKVSSILKKCEGARGILYLKAVEDQPFYPHCVVKKTKILEVKNVSMKIRIYGKEITNQMIYIEDVLGFLKEVY